MLRLCAQARFLDSAIRNLKDSCWLNMRSGQSSRGFSSSAQGESAESFLEMLETARPSIELGLDVSKDLLRKVGDPQNVLKVIHVAGTNGKGSTCAMIASALQCAGLRVGVFNSPHLLKWSDTVLVNGSPDDGMWRKAMASVQQAAGGSAGAVGKVTAFEASCAAMWVQLAMSEVDVAVVEVGVGGRLDATNVCDAVEASVICSIGFDHQNLLGSTLPEIAREKAGILKPNCPAIVTSTLAEPAKRTVADVATAVGAAPMIWAPPASSVDEGRANESGVEGVRRRRRRAAWGELEFELALHGEFQFVNAGLALSALKLLQQRWGAAGLRGRPLLDAHICNGMKTVTWPGRLEWAEVPGGVGHVLLDGAHNREAAAALREYVDSLNPVKVEWIVGMVQGKDVAGLAAALMRAGDAVTAVPIHTLPRRHCHVPPQQITSAARSCGVSNLKCTEATGLEAALKTWAEAGSRAGVVRVVCGSLHLLGDFKQLHS